MNFWKKAVCAALAATLTVLVGCSGNNKSWVYQYGDQQPSAGLYLIYLISAASAADSKNAAANADNSEYEAPSYKQLLKGTVEDQPAEQWIEADALRQMKEYFAVEEQFAARGLTLTPEEITSAKNAAAKSWETYGTFYESNGVALSSMELQMQNSLKRNKLFMAIYGEGGEKAVSTDALKAAFEADYGKTDLMVFSKAHAESENQSGEKVSIEAQNAEIKARAEGYLARLAAGEELADLVFEQETEDAKDSGQTPTKPEPGERSVIVSKEDTGNGYYSAKLVEGVMAAPMDTPVIVEDDNYYYVVRRTDILKDPADLEAYRETLLNSMKAEEFKASVAQWAQAITPEANSAAVSSYKASKLKID